MNEFQYNTTPQEQAMTDLLKSQSYRLARQQVIFALVFLLVIVALAYYVVSRIIWATYDGYITLDENKVTAIDDIYVLEVKKEVGEIVHKGDTLYSYVLIDNILSQYDPNTLPTFVKETQDMELQARLAREEIPVLKTRLQELRKQKASESSDIYYGLTDNTKRNQLDAEIAEVEEQLRRANNRVRIYASMKNTTYKFMAGRGGGGYQHIPYSTVQDNYSKSLIHYCCAPVDAYVSKIDVTDRMVAFKQQDIMTIQCTDYQSCHLGIITYVPSDMVKYMQCPEDADILFNNDLTLKAKLQMVGLRVEEIPKYLQSNFSHDAKATVAYFTFNGNQRVPAWAMSNALPVRVRVNKIKAMLHPRPLPMYTIPKDMQYQTINKSNMVSAHEHAADSIKEHKKVKKNDWTKKK